MPLIVPDLAAQIVPVLGLSPQLLVGAVYLALQLSQRGPRHPLHALASLVLCFFQRLVSSLDVTPVFFCCFLEFEG